MTNTAIFRILFTIATFQIVFFLISIGTGLRTEIEFFFNFISLSVLTVLFSKHRKIKLGKTGLWISLGLMIGKALSYLWWFASEYPTTDWYPGLIVSSVGATLGLISIWITILGLVLYRK